MDTVKMTIFSVLIADLFAFAVVFIPYGLLSKCGVDFPPEQGIWMFFSVCGMMVVDHIYQHRIFKMRTIA